MSLADNEFKIHLAHSCFDISMQRLQGQRGDAHDLQDNLERRWKEWHCRFFMGNQGAK